MRHQYGPTKQPGQIVMWQPADLDAVSTLTKSDDSLDRLQGLDAIEVEGLDTFEETAGADEIESGERVLAGRERNTYGISLLADTSQKFKTIRDHLLDIAPQAPE